MEHAIDVKALREALCLSQAALGQAVGVDQSTVSNWENGKPPRGPARKLLETLAQALPAPCDADVPCSPDFPQDADRVSTAGAPGDLAGAPALSVPEAAE